jgi:hypothetical protein
VCTEIAQLETEAGVDHVAVKAAEEVIRRLIE